MVGIVMGSKNDWSEMVEGVRILNQFQVPFEVGVVSAHRTPDLLYRYARSATERNYRCIIAGAGGAAHLPGMLAALTAVPVLGVPLLGASSKLGGLDALLSIAQMPTGVPVATFSLGTTGAKNAALFAVALLAGTDERLARELMAYRSDMVYKVLEEDNLDILFECEIVCAKGKAK